MINRFMNKVLPEPNSGCWLWDGAVDGCGYGLFGVGGSGNSKRAHRVSYELFIGNIEDGKFICHKCDVPSCVNPDHLFCGSPKENSEDRDRKKRTALGIKNGKSKLTPKEIIFIKSTKISERKLAALLGVSRGTVNAVRSGKTWKFCNQISPTNYRPV